MRVKLEWLNELVDLNGLSTTEIVDKLALNSIEVESVFKIVEGTNLTIGHVLTKTPHPDSDHLNILTVDVKTEVLQIVCGAPNVEVGQFVIIALVGATLPGDFKIKKSKIRGVESFGMVCSLAELGMDKKYVPSKFENGIYYFEDQVEVGSDPLIALNLADDIIELGITPNRGDLLSMLGVAIEVSAVFNRPLKPLTFKLLTDNDDTNNYLHIKNDTDKCLVYNGRLIKDVQIKPSPRWLRARLNAFGIRSINNVVDITNYILALFGQPLHAFDYQKLGKKIVVRNALENEELITLDNQTRILKSTDIVITDGAKPVALAGVMGGLDTEVTEDTKDIVLEAAVFNPLTVRQTASRLHLHSESSMRYERGVDLNQTATALEYACFLLKELANAKVLKNNASDGIKQIADTEIDLSSDYVNHLLGTTITKEEMVKILLSLGFKVEVKDNLKVLVPNRRSDVKTKADLAEEIGRLSGYYQLPPTLPNDRMAGRLSSSQKRRRTLRHNLINLGLTEVISYSLVDEKANQEFKYLYKEGSSPVVMLKPMSEDHSQMRHSQLASLIKVVEYNVARKVKDVNVFEIGKVYYQINDQYYEDETLSIVLSGSYTDTLWNQQIEKANFYLLKGIINQALSNLKVELDFQPLDKEELSLHPKRSARILHNNQVIGYIGELHPQFLKTHDLEETYVLELTLTSILNQEEQVVRYQQISKAPSVERDIAIVLEKSILVGDVISMIKANGGHDLKDVKVFDLYSGDKIDKQLKSLAIRMTWISNETLTDDQINARVSKILKLLEKTYQAKLRS